MKKVSFVLAGLGSVGCGFLRLMLEERSRLLQSGIDLVPLAAVDSTGVLYDLTGIDVPRLLAAKRDGRGAASVSLSRVGQSLEKVLEMAPADLYIDCLPADCREAGDRALQALQKGMGVITANKSYLAQDLLSYSKLAEKKGVPLRYSAAANAGLPGSLQQGKVLAEGGELTGFTAIFSSTCSYLVKEMAKGTSFEEALAMAQALDIAETDPSADISGADAAAKLVIHANTFWPQLGLTRDQVVCTPVNQLPPCREGEKLRFAAVCRPAEGHFTVSPVAVPATSSLVQITDRSKAILFETVTQGKILCRSFGYGAATAGTILCDVTAAAKALHK